MAFRMSTMLVGYAALLCAALICSCVVFSVRMRTCVMENAMQMSALTMSRYIVSTSTALKSVEMSVSRIAFALAQTARLASKFPINESLLHVDGAFQMLRPSNSILSILAQEEVWWDGEEGRFITAGCYRYGTLCYRSNGNTTSYVSSTFPGSRLDYQAVYTDPEPSQYYDLHDRMLRQPQFTADEGVWTPQVARFTLRKEATPCGNGFIEYIMAYYHCITYVESGQRRPFPIDEALPLRHGYCKHAVMAVVDLRYRLPFMSKGISSQSTVSVQSLLVLDEVQNASCTRASDQDVEALDGILARANHLAGPAAPQWILSEVKSENVVTSGLMRRSNGVLIAYREMTPNAFFLTTSRSDNVTSALLTTVLVLVVLVVTFFMWCTVTRPLQQVCLSMHRTTMGIMDSDEPEEGGERAGRAAPASPPGSRVLVKEVHDLYQTYRRLRIALSELKAFAPQGLFVLEKDASAAADTPTVELAELSHSSWESNEQLPHIGGPEPASQCRSAALRSGTSCGRCAPPRTPQSCLHATSCPLDAALPCPSCGAGGSPSLPAASSAPAVVAPPPRWSVCGEERPLLLPPLLLSAQLTRSSTSPLSTGVEGCATRLDLPVPTCATAFRMVNCSTLTVSYHYAVSNLEMAAAEVQQFMEVAISTILAHGGTVEVFRPEVLVAAFGAHREDALHTKHALKCAVHLFDAFSLSQKKRVSLLLDTGNIYVGTCGAHERYARVIAGDRVDFIMRARLHALAVGRIITTDSITLSRHTRNYYFLPFDNIIPRGGFGLQRSSTVLFRLFPKHSLPPGSGALIAASNEVFRAAVNGLYDVAMARLSGLAVIDPVLRDAFVNALRTILSVSPRRPRYCRFELPPFETLGFTATPLSQSQAYRPLLIHELEPAVPRVRFLSATEQLLEPRASLTALAAVPHHATRERRPSLSLLSPSPVESGGGGGGGLACASVDRSTIDSSVADFFLSGEPTPRAFRDSRGDCWTLVPECIGRGASSEVYKAFSSDGVIMAVKCIQLARRDMRVSDVVAEVNTSCQLSSEYIVNCTAWAHVGTYLFIVMELLAGGSLHDTLHYFPHGIAYPLARRYAADVLRGLDYLHRNGIVHADVKPQNMLLATDGGCRISDFGSSVTKTGARLGPAGDVYALRGTPLYMSPEVARGDPPTAKSDVWSFGVSFYEVLTGQLPWVWRSSGGLVYPCGRARQASVNATVRRPSQLQPAAALPVHHRLHAAAAPTAAAGSPVELQHYFTPGAAPGRATEEPSSVAAVCSPPSSPLDIASFTPAAAQMPSTPVLTTSAFLQGVIRGDIVARIDPSLFTSAEAQHVIDACLRVRPEERLTVEGLLYMQYFYV